MKDTDPLVVIVEVVPDCGADPVRLACGQSGIFSHAVWVMVSDDDAPADAPRYFLNVSCREANIDRISQLYSFHGGSDREGSSIPLAEDRDSLCVHNERCALSRLTLQELFYPLVTYELGPYKVSVDSHRHN